jgi:hypothetical protein
MADMSKAVARFAFVGPFEAGTLDARTLAPTLLGLAELVEAANERLNGDRAKMQVRVRANFKAGSFDVSYEVWQTFLQTISNIAGHGRTYSAGEVMAFLGLGTAAVKGVAWAKNKALGALQFYREWEALKPDAELEIGPDGLQKVTIRGKLHRIPREVLALVRDPRIQSASQRVVGPVLAEGIEALEIRPPSRRGKTPLDVIGKTEVREIAAGVRLAQESETPKAEREDVLHTSKRESIYRIVKPALLGSYDWVFSEGDETTPFSAPIEDAGFLERRDRREITFGAGDLLKVEVESTAVRTASNRLVQHNRVLRVLEILPPGGPQQGDLFKPDPTDT